MSNNLKEYLRRCKEAYYAGSPIISDSQYDALEEACNAELEIGTNRGRTKHWFKMYSLQKVYTDERLPLNKEACIVTPKLDGAAVAVRYVNGTVDSVVTRGNGEYGEDITHLFSTSAIFTKCCIPTHLGNEFMPPYEGIHQITGEMVSPKHISDNPRNYAAGALNLKDSKEFAERTVKFVPYDVQPLNVDGYDSVLKWLSILGFLSIGDKDITNIFPQDGLVYRVRDNDYYQKMGFTSKHPRGAFALKERTEGVKTTILDVIWQTGKTGKVTPVALLDPVDIDGARVSRATLNNPGFIEALGVQIGDSVMVERAGGIIPRIIRKAE